MPSAWLGALAPPLPPPAEAAAAAAAGPARVWPVPQGIQALQAASRPVPAEGARPAVGGGTAPWWGRLSSARGRACPAEVRTPRWLLEVCGMAGSLTSAEAAADEVEEEDEGAAAAAMEGCLW